MDTGEKGIKKNLDKMENKEMKEEKQKEQKEDFLWELINDWIILEVFKKTEVLLFNSHSIDWS